MIWYAAITPPKGWIICNGQATTAYPELASIVGSHVPDLRGEFVRGLDLGRNIDVGRVFRSWQTDTFTDHTHYISMRGRTGSDSSWDPTPHWSSGDYGYVGPSSAKSSGASIGAGAETRPRNVALLPCIKY
ncbi:MAG: tail fiber protein [Sporomusaceae bacterium]|nr:tail fiber protein [Sporomusaceae bacterium]